MEVAMIMTSTPDKSKFSMLSFPGSPETGQFKISSEILELGTAKEYWRLANDGATDLVAFHHAYEERPQGALQA